MSPSQAILWRRGCQGWLGHAILGGDGVADLIRLVPLPASVLAAGGHPGGPPGWPPITPPHPDPWVGWGGAIRNTDLSNYIFFICFPFFPAFSTTWQRFDRTECSVPPNCRYHSVSLHFTPHDFAICAFEHTSGYFISPHLIGLQDPTNR